MDSFHTGTPPKHKEEDNEPDIDLLMLDSEDDESSNPNDYCPYNEKVSTRIQMFIIFITSIRITN
jgi:hypothetical protein